MGVELCAKQPRFQQEGGIGVGPNLFKDRKCPCLSYFVHTLKNIWLFAPDLPAVQDSVEQPQANASEQKVYGCQDWAECIENHRTRQKQLPASAIRGESNMNK